MHDFQRPILEIGSIVCVLQGVTYFAANVCHHVRWQGGVTICCNLKDGFQVLSWDIVSSNKASTIHVTNFVNLNDVLMVQCCSSFGLYEEQAVQLFIVDVFFSYTLDGDGLLKPLGPLNNRLPDLEGIIFVNHLLQIIMGPGVGFFCGDFADVDVAPADLPVGIEAE